MKIRIVDRVTAALSALLLLVGAGIVVADGFFGQHVLDFFVRLFASTKIVPIICKALAVAVLLVLALGCLSITVRRRNDRRSVSQKTDNGELSISVKAIEGLVKKCVDTHEEMQVSSLSLDNERNGLVIRLRIATGSNVSIPLVVAALQKQLKQYITACTGLDVKEVCVQVDTAEADVKQSVYDLPDMLGEQSMQRSAEEVREETEKKLPHQRMFEAEAPQDVQMEEKTEPAQEESAESEEVEKSEVETEEIPQDAEEAETAGEDVEEPDTADAEDEAGAEDAENTVPLFEQTAEPDAEQDAADEQAAAGVTIDAGT